MTYMNLRVRLADLPAFSDSSNGLTTRDERIRLEIDLLKKLKEKLIASTSDLAMELNCSHPTMRNQLKKLENAGLIFRTESANKTYWALDQKYINQEDQA